jgi:hypothetical protein
MGPGGGKVFSATQAQQRVCEEAVREALDQVLVYQAVAPACRDGGHRVVRTRELAADGAHHIRMAAQIDSPE